MNFCHYLAPVIRTLDTLLSPPVCPVCEKHLSANDAPGRLCDYCDAATPRLPEMRCRLCGAPLNTALELCRECTAETRPWLAGTCAFPYDGPAGEWIRAYKYGRKTALAPVLAREMALAWKAHGKSVRPEIIVPIPLHWRRQRVRGFNQAELLAQFLAPQLGMRCVNALKRRYATAHQARLTESSRLKNLQKAFVVVDAEAIAGKSVLVVDDVFTTGATFTAACQALLAGGAAETAVLAIARA
ncbi:MAG: ComF family protein [Lentisphaeria bacterium]|nr:ComF family protein [Lentisphaeria bacterium]